MDKLSPADEYEAGKDAAAARNWARLLHLEPKWTAAHVGLVDFLRRLYRSSAPLVPDDLFLPGGSLVFNGAHIRARGDRGQLYEALRGAKGLTVHLRKGRLHGSSHSSLLQQFEIAIPHAGSVLVGCGVYMGCAGGEHTWLQCEAHPAAGGFTSWLLHGLDWVNYMTHHKQQVGPFGYSPYSEKPPRTNPLIARTIPPFD